MNADGQPRIAILASSSAANALRSFSNSLLTVALPFILVLVLPPASYSAWILLFGMAAYIIYLDLGLQPVIQSMVGRFEGSGNRRSSLTIIGSSLKLMAIVACICLPVAYMVATAVGSLFPSVPPSLIPDFQFAFVITVFGQLAILVSNVVMSYHAGRQRLLKPSVLVAGSRVVALTSAGASAFCTTSLTLVALALSIPLVLGLVLLLFGLQREFKAPQIELRVDVSVTESPTGMKSLLRYSGPLVLWNVCMIFVNGAGVILVAKLDYQLLAAYGVASMFVAVIIGLENAFVGPLLSEMGRRNAAGISRPDDLRISSRINGVFLVAVSMLMLAVFPAIKWIFPDHVRESLGFGLLVIMLLGNQLRLAMTPLSMHYIATQNHRRIIAPPIIETMISVGSGVILGMLFGLVGVISGALLGSVAGVGLALTWSARLARVEIPDKWTLIGDAIVKPLACFTPSFVAAGYVGFGLVSSSWPSLGVTLGSAAVSAFLVWYVAFGNEERRLFTTLVRHVFRRP